MTRTWVTFGILVFCLTGCHLNAERFSAISTNVPKGYAKAAAVKNVSWEDKVDAAMKLGAEAQAEATPVSTVPLVAVKTAVPAKPSIESVVAAHTIYHPKRALTRIRHKRTKAKKKAWYDKLLGRK